MHKNCQYKTHRGGKIWKSKDCLLYNCTESFSRFFPLRSQEETTARPETGSLVWFPDRQINQWCTGPTAPTHITHSLCLYSYLQVWGGFGAGTSRSIWNTNKPDRTRWFPQKTGRVRKETRIIWCAECFLSCRISWLCSVDWSDIIRLCRLVEILMWFAELVQVILTCSPAVDHHSAVGWI